jgi:rod shape-determining protein MreC
VIADTSSSYVRSLIVLAGAGDGVVKGQAAITGAGLAGRVLEVGQRASRILLLTDISARIPVIVERTRDQAVLAGNNSENPELQFLPRDVDIKVGDRIVTSGVGGNFPAGLPVGEVVRATDGRIYVQLYAQLDRMEYLRLVNYSLPGILMQDLGVDTSKSQEIASPSRARFAPGVQ